MRELALRAMQSVAPLEGASGEAKVLPKGESSVGAGAGATKVEESRRAKLRWRDSVDLAPVLRPFPYVQLFAPLPSSPEPYEIRPPKAYPCNAKSLSFFSCRRDPKQKEQGLFGPFRS